MQPLPTVQPARRHGNRLCIEEIAALLEGPGKRHAAGRSDGVPALSHALQCAQLAEWAHAEPELVGAALLHDIGHLLPDTRPLSEGEAAIDHASRAAAWLSPHWPDALTEPVRLHAAAKRYLVGFDPRYQEALSVASLHSLSRQGGAMSPVEMRRFEALTHAGAAIKLRIWDDMAHHAGKATPSLQYYLDLLERLLPPVEPQRGHRPIALVVA